IVVGTIRANKINKNSNTHTVSFFEFDSMVKPPYGIFNFGFTVKSHKYAFARIIRRTHRAPGCSLSVAIKGAESAEIFLPVFSAAGGG
ncbi:MAG: hypothetical protein WC109_05645, partial [Syntrophomonadaceae bacterium]